MNYSEPLFFQIIKLYELFCTIVKYWLFLMNSIRLAKKVKDKIWDRNPSKSEVIARCGGDEKNRMITQNRQKPNAKIII